MNRFIVHLAILTLILAGNYQSHSQQGNYWYFGTYAGLNFNTTPPSVLTDGQLSSPEGCATISDSLGHLLFYTDGIHVYNRLHQLMPSGNNLMGHPSASNSAIVVPQPGSSYLYYIFTTDAVENGLANGYRYSIVDLRLNGGLGDVTVKNVLLFAPGTEKLTAVAHRNGTDVWIITLALYSNSFRAYRLGCSGLDSTAVVSNAGWVNDNLGTAIGCIKASPDNKKLATSRIVNGGWELFDFDNATGIVSNPLFISSPNQVPFGVEFSPNSQLVYIAGSYILQYKINIHDANTIAQSRYRVDSNIIFFNQSKNALQLGPDNKIYSGIFSSHYINVIHNPNEYGPLCQYQDTAINLGDTRWVVRCFPVFYSGVVNNTKADFSFTFSPDCKTIEFTGSSVYTGNLNWFWNFGDGTTGTGQSVSHIFPGTTDSFRVVLTVENPLECGAYTSKMKVVAFNRPVLHADFTILPAECGEKEISFRDSSSISGAAFSGWQWDFGDGHQSTMKDPVHLFDSVGNYTVKLIVSANNACQLKDTMIRQVRLRAMPDAGFTVLGGCVNEVVRFTNTSTIQGGSMAGWYWNLGNIRQSTNTDEEAIFPNYGNYRIELIAVSQDNCADTISQDLIIETKPLAGFALSEGCQGRHLDLHSDAFIEHGIMDGHYWDFGNGDFSQDSIPSYSYPLYGQYLVRHAVVSRNGCRSDTVSKTITIESVPDIGFSFGTTCLGNPVQFQNNTTNQFGAILDWNWNFGDGQGSGQPAPSHTYVRYGNFPVSLSCTTANGCEAALTKNISISPLVIDAGADTAIVRNTPLQLSVTGAANYVWTPSTGLSSNVLADPVAVLDRDQTYYIKGIDASCCVGYDTFNIKVFSKADVFVPNAFTPGNDGRNDRFGPVCAGIKSLSFFEVYNRWGQLVYHTTDSKGRWDGTLNGRPQAQGVYVWLVKAIDDLGNRIEKKGTVVLIR